MMAVLGPERVESAGLFRRALEPVDEMLIDEARRRRAADDLDERDDVLSLLVQARHEDGRPMSDAELRDELITLLVAGHETTATSLSWAIERLVRHPEKWERLREEALGGEDAYADAVAKETLRLRPVLPIVVRRLTQPVEIGGWPLPAGAHASHPASTSCTGGPTCTPSRMRSARSASSTSRRAPTRGFRSAAGCAAAWARPLRCSR